MRERNYDPARFGAMMAVPPRSKDDTLAHYSSLAAASAVGRDSAMAEESSRPPIFGPEHIDHDYTGLLAISEWAANRQRHSVRSEYGSVRLSAVTVLFGILSVLMVVGLIAYGAVMGSNVTPPASATTSALQLNMANCRRVATDCHVETDSDGTQSVYGTWPTINGPERTKVQCQEDDPCWHSNKQGE